MNQIKCHIKHYEWGIKGEQSLVAQLGLKGKHVDSIDQDLPYAELWLGTHPNGKSQFIKNDLPYLLKILSVGKTLSIQIHPNKELAQQLHQEKPNIYPDSNHKPELAICLSETFEAFCGLKENPEISLNELLNLSSQEVKTIFEKYKNNDLIKKLNQQYGFDNGILAPLVMNYISLKKGEALVIYPDTPHAYISGEIVECMACSDNVIRLGLTPKIKDIETLNKLLIKNDFEILQKQQIYNKFDEFSLEMIEINNKLVKKIPGHSILLILEGEGKINNIDVLKGNAFYFDTEELLNINSNHIKIVIVFS